MASVPPPGGNGTIQRTALSGYCANAPKLAQASRAIRHFFGLIRMVAPLAGMDDWRRLRHSKPCRYWTNATTAGGSGDDVQGLHVSSFCAAMEPLGQVAHTCGVERRP